MRLREWQDSQAAGTGRRSLIRTIASVMRQASVGDGGAKGGYVKEDTP